jgi:uncharacterized protein YneF (UPF0154 family)
MYCPNCTKEIAGSLSFCNHCGFKLKEAGNDRSKLSEVKPGLLVSAMVGLFIFGLVAISVLIGVMKQVAGFDPEFLTIITIFSFVVMLMIEGVLVLMLFRRKKVEKQVSDINQLNEQNIKEIYAAPTRGLSESTFQPVSSVTEHTTRTLEKVPKNNL